MNDETLIKESIFKIGKVTSVEGREVRVSVDKLKNTSHIVYKGDLLKNISVGSYIKICKGFTRIIGKVEGEYINENIKFTADNYRDDKEKIDRVLKINLLGFFNGNEFERGIKELPLIDNECYLLEKEEFDQVHNFIRNTSPSKPDQPLNIGTLSLEKGQPIQLGINGLFTSHIGIFGNTGSGKSYTLAKIYFELFTIFSSLEPFKKNASFLLFDFNGEYSSQQCITSSKKVYNLTTKRDGQQKFPLSEDDLIDTELVSILSDATEKTQRPFINRCIGFYKEVSTKESPIEYYRNVLKKRIKDVLKMADKEKAMLLLGYLRTILWDEIINNEEMDIDTYEWNNTNKHFMPRGGPSRELYTAEIESTEIYRKAIDYNFPPNILSKLIHFLYMQLIYDVYTDKAKNDHIAPAINKLRSKRQSIDRVLDTTNTDAEIFSERNFIVINLYDVNMDMKKTLPLLLSKKVYSDHKDRQRVEEPQNYLNIIIDEAHNILSRESVREAESWKDYRLETFEEIIKEGRKFGVFLTIASQRPSDISPTIISQLHNYFLHRLINNQDILAIERTISYLDKVSMDSLSLLPTGTCILAGLIAQIPVIIDIGILPSDCEPNNKTMTLIDKWGGEIAER